MEEAILGFVRWCVANGHGYYVREYYALPEFRGRFRVVRAGVLIGEGKDAWVYEKSRSFASGDIPDRDHAYRACIAEVVQAARVHATVAREG